MPLLAFCSLHVWMDGKELGREVVECRYERGADVSDWEDDELHPSPVFLEGRDEGGSISRSSSRA